MTDQAAARELWLRFFDIDVKLASDSANLLDLFGQVYRRFLITETDARPRPLSFFVLSQPDRGRQPFLIIDRDVWPLPEPELMPGYVFQRITTAIAQRIQSHLLFHAGAVTHGGQAVILAGDSFHGKTTLVMELVRRGSKFLSDETAAVSRASGQAFPFPRALRVRSGSLKLASFAPNPSDFPNWFGKTIIDIEQLKPDCLAQAAPVSRVVVLRRPNETDTARRELVLVLDRVDDDFLAEVRQIKGVTNLHTTSQYRYPVLKLIASRKTLTFARIETLCDKHRILILDVHTGANTTPSFSGPAELTPISTSQAAMELLQRFQGGFQSAILQESGATALFLEMSRWLGQAKCFQLTTGPLPQMADQVSKLLGLTA
jgi:hypothetical protein